MRRLCLAPQHHLRPRAVTGSVAPGSLQCAPGAPIQVLVPVFDGLVARKTSVRPALLPYGDVVSFSYDNNSLSNVDPVALADRMGSEIQRLYTAGRYRSVVLIGHSIGALVARQACLSSAKAGAAWIGATRRIVLLAGMNHGWDVTGRDRWTCLPGEIGRAHV